MGWDVIGPPPKSTDDSWIVLVTFAGARRGDEWVTWKDSDTSEWALAKADSDHDAVNRVLDSLPLERHEDIRSIRVGRITNLRTVPYA